MHKRRLRRWSMVVLAIVAVSAGTITWFTAAASLGESVRSFRATATWDADRRASVHEEIDYVFPRRRHGIYRVLPGVAWDRRDDISVTADHTTTWVAEPEIAAIRQRMQALGVERMTVDSHEVATRVRIGDPEATVKGIHHYTVDYPLEGTELGDDRIGWNGVGASWDVPIDRVALELRAPWVWEDATCDTGSAGSVGGCRVTQAEPGRLTVDHGRLDAGEGITVYATRGADLAAAPAARAVAVTTDVAWWRRPSRLAGLVVVVVLGAGIVVARLLRRAGRDWVMAGPASTDSAVDLAFEVPSTGSGLSGARRVDDSRLGTWVGTEFAPPRGLPAWQGGIVTAERVRAEHRVAWLLQAAADGYVRLEPAGPGAVTLHRRSHDDDATSRLLDIAFVDRERMLLGPYDPRFARAWAAVGAMQDRWASASVYNDQRAARRVVPTVIAGCVAFAVAIPLGIASVGLVARFGPAWVAVTVFAAVCGGGGIAAALRGWELRVRTPAGTAMWLRIESFRRFLAGSETEHVRRAAEQGRLREYTAWAVSLGESDHWNATIASAGLAPDVDGVATSALSPRLFSACTTASTSPSTSGSGGGSGGGGGGGGSGVGGGGGGGGGGSW